MPAASAAVADPPLDADELAAIVQSRHAAPHRVLGPHPVRDGTATIVRVFLPHVDRAAIRFRAKAAPDFRSGAASVAAMRRIGDEGMFEAILPLPFGSADYEFLLGDSPASAIDDPFRFPTPRFDADDERRFVEGRHHRLFDRLGAQMMSIDGIDGVAFGVWAANARRVSVVGTFNGWDGRIHPMQRVSASGVWELFIPGVTHGALYKFEIKTAGDAVFLKTDPFARVHEAAPADAAIVAAAERPAGRRDAARMRTGRAAMAADRGLHARDLDAAALVDATASPTAAATLLAAVADDGYTAVSLPAPACAVDAIGMFAPGPGCGGAEGLAAFIDACHDRGLGVVMADIGTTVPAGLGNLAWFDGSRLYEREAIGTATDEPLHFDLRKGEVRSVLASNAAFWLERLHVDALACDPAGAERLGELLRCDGFGAVRLIVIDAASPTTLSPADIARLITGRLADPYGVLGPQPVLRPANPPVNPPANPVLAASEARPVEHPPAEPKRVATGEIVVRALLPGAREVQLLTADQPHIVRRLQPIDAAGLFEVVLAAAPSAYRLRVFAANGDWHDIIDGYALRDFAFTLDDQRLFGEGNHYRIYEKLGAHPRRIGDIHGVGFAVWAPEAEGIGVVGPFNHWDGRAHPMQRHGMSGVWEVFIPGLGEGDLYKFEIRARNGHIFLKTDPYAFFTEVPPATASVVCRLDGAHDWHDQEWMQRRRSANPWQQPMTIYEVHPGSWMRTSDGRPLSYRELAAKLVPYVKTLGFTHIELLPIAEHPYEPSWGYQVSNFYAPTSRFGGPADLMAFIDACHAADIGVILDWVPGHFPKDAHALAWFDGTHLYEHADPRKGEHPDWGTLIFNYGRHEVENFLIANALFWLEHYHFDGLRVDAVASMLYLDYSRPASGGWIPNAYGGKENLEAVEFLKHTNSILHARFPGILMIAEESTSWPNVSRPADHGGLGFGFKWNMGWMHDALAYMSVPPSERKWHHGRLTFGLMYAFSENFILSLSHDEVVHMKRSLFGKMPGEDWAKFANLRLLFSFMYAHPGKKLLFMGGELGQESEWDHARGLDWRALENKANRGLQWFFQDLNRLYRAEPALHQQDFRSTGFEWLEVENGDESIIAFLRKAREPRDTVLFAANFGDVSRPGHRIGVPYPVAYSALFDSNSARYGGCDARPEHRRVVHAEEVAWHDREFSIRIDLPALAAVVLKPAPAQVD